MATETEWRDVTASQRVPSIGGHRQSLKRQGKIPPRVLGEPGPANTLLSDVWPPEPCKNTFVLFPASHSVALCCGSPRALTQKSPMQPGNQQRPHPWQGTIRKGVYLLPEQRRQIGPPNWKVSPGTLVIFPWVTSSPSVPKATAPFQTLLSLTPHCPLHTSCLRQRTF